MRYPYIPTSGLGLVVALTSAQQPLVSGQYGAIEARQSLPDYPAHNIDVPIDHFPNISRYEPHTNATFKQRYFFDSSYYKPGGPVYLYIGGETSGESRFSNLQTGSKLGMLWSRWHSILTMVYKSSRSLWKRPMALV